MHKVLMCVIQPGPRGESEDRRLRFDLHANEADRSCAQKSKEMIRLTQEYVTWRYNHLVRVSVSCPFTGSNTVLRRTPVCKPMLTNIVG